MNWCFSWENFKKNFMAPFYGWGSTASRLEPLQGGSLLFLPLSSQKFLVPILSTLEGWNAESTLEPPSGFEHRTPGLGIQQLTWACSDLSALKKIFFPLVRPAK